MKKAVLAALAAVALGCTSIESAVVKADEVTSAHGEAVAVVQATTLGLTLFFHTWELGAADLDVVTKALVSEAKALGASRVDIRDAVTMPRHGIFRVVACPTVVICPTLASATGVAVK